MCSLKFGLNAMHPGVVLIPIHVFVNTAKSDRYHRVSHHSPLTASITPALCHLPYQS